VNQNWICLHATCQELNEKLADALFVDSYSNGVDDLVLVFETPDSQYAIKCLFLEGAMYLVFMDLVPNPSTKALHWFKGGHGFKLKAFKPNGLDRSFRLELDSNSTIVFKMYGRMSNVLFFKEKARPTEIFRSVHKKDLELKLSHFPKEMSFNMTYNNKEEFAANNKHLPHAIIDLAFESYQRGSLEEHIKQQIEGFSKSWGLVPSKFGFTLSVLESEYESVLNACNELVKQHFPIYVFTKEKGRLTQGKTKEINRLAKQIKALEVNQIKVYNRKSSKEIADILMANLHKVKKGVTSVELFDFYENKNICIKLNKDLSPQANAEKYYKKSKNGGKELEEIEKKLKLFAAQIEQLKKELLVLEDVTDFKSLKPFAKNEVNKGPKVQKALPYWSFALEGLEVLVGKNAKSNDELLRLTRKNDWWFHAKDVAGSHCIVRNNGVALTPVQLEKVGALAAYYSKAKSQTLAPVMYTLRKYVRKPKGFLPGKVIVEKEDVILVEPSPPQKL